MTGSFFFFWNWTQYSAINVTRYFAICSIKSFLYFPPELKPSLTYLLASMPFCIRHSVSDTRYAVPLMRDYLAYTCATFPGLFTPFSPLQMGLLLIFLFHHWDPPPQHVHTHSLTPSLSHRGVLMGASWPSSTWALIGRGIFLKRSPVCSKRHFISMFVWTELLVSCGPVIWLINDP